MHCGSCQGLSLVSVGFEVCRNRGSALVYGSAVFFCVDSSEYRRESRLEVEEEEGGVVVEVR